ncbi:hypothetical protein pb186bvf_008790 [Paramecium bursaria]
MKQETNTQLAQEDQIYFYKLPQLIVPSQQTVIGVIDASFSIQPYWENIVKNWKKFTNDQENKDFKSSFLTFTFSHTLIFQKKQLSNSIHQYGGFQSDIERAVLKLINYIHFMDLAQEQMTLYFISDGIDSEQSTLIERLQKIPRVQYKCRVICVSLGKEFPIELSVELRRIFNNVDKHIPYIQKVNNPEYLQNYLDQYKYPKTHKIKFDIPINIFPWVQNAVNKTNLMPVWGFIKGQQYLKIQLKNKGVEQRIRIRGNMNLYLEEQRELSQFYLDHLSQIKDHKLKSNNANMALAFLRKYVYPGSVNEMPIFSLQQINVGQRRLSTFIFRFNALIAFSSLTNEEQQNVFLTREENQIFKQMPAQELSKSKYLAITNNDFLNAKEEFVKILIQTFIEDDDLRSVITLQSMSEILKQRDIIEDINNCKSLPQLLLTFPIVGLSIYVQRDNNQIFDPFKIVIQSISRHHKCIDSVSLISNNNFFVFNTGSSGIEKVNCLVPIINNKSMSKIISSTLFNMIVNYVVNNIINAQNHKTYIGILTKTYIHLITLEESSWQQELKQRVLYTFGTLIIQNPIYQKANQIIQDNPERAFRIQAYVSELQDSPYTFRSMFYFLNNFTGLKYGIYFIQGVIRKMHNLRVKQFFKIFIKQEQNKELIKIESMDRFKNIEEIGDIYINYYKQDAQVEFQNSVYLEFFDQKSLQEELAIYFQLTKDKLQPQLFMKIIYLNERDSKQIINETSIQEINDQDIQDYVIQQLIQAEFKEELASLKQTYIQKIQITHQFNNYPDLINDLNKLNLTQKAQITQLCLIKGCHSYLQRNCGFKQLDGVLNLILKNKSKEKIYAYLIEDLRYSETIKQNTEQFLTNMIDYVNSLSD